MRLALLFTAILGLFTNSGPVLAQAPCPPTCPPEASYTFYVGGNRQTFKITYVEGSYQVSGGRTIISYDLSGPEPMSHFVLGACRELFDNLVSVTYKGYTFSSSYANPDPTSGLYGIKIDPAKTGRYTFTFEGYWELGCTEVAMKQGTKASPRLDIIGLLCEQRCIEPEITCPPNAAVGCDGSTDPSQTGVPTTTGTRPISLKHSDRNLTSWEISTLVQAGKIPSNCTGKAVIKRTWTATNICGSDSCYQYIYRVDTTPPVATDCPPDKTIDCKSTPTFGTPVFTDTCDANLKVTYSDTRQDLACGYQVTRTWTAKDDCGNEATCSQTITVADTTAPTITPPAAKTIECDEPPVFDTPTVTDTCDPSATYEQVGTDAKTDLDCGYTLTRTWIARDQCGNTSQPVSQTITVLDTTAPTITAPAAQSIECDQTPTFGTPTVSDACDVNATYQAVGDPVRAELACGYTLTQAWIAKDACGNTSEPVSQTITVVDTTAPTITAPAAHTIECDVNPVFGTPSVTDSCDAAATYQAIGDPIRVDLTCGYTLTQTWIAKDTCGNTSEPVSQTITVLDTEAPAITAPAAQTIECDANPEFGTPTVSDTCDPNATFEQVGTDVRAYLACGYTLTRTWIARDACGNASQPVSQTITVLDTKAPTITAPAAQTIECDQTPVFGTPTVTDACDPNATYEQVGQDARVNLDCGYTLTRTWIARDECGNTCEPVSQTITVLDTQAPTITAPTAETIECDGTPVFGTPTVTDTCDTNATYEQVGTDTRVELDCGYTLTRTWVAKDSCGNTSEPVSQTITVIDTQAPEITAPAAQTIECNENPVFGTPSVTDTCDANATYQAVGDPVRVDLACGYTLTQTWTAKDVCGNTSQPVSQTITVVDTKAPTIIAPAAETIECDENPVFGTPTVTDSCDPNATYEQSGTDARSDLDCGYTLTRTWVAKDTCGNTSEPVSQTITVIDTTALSITAPAAVTIECDEAPVFGTPTVSDNCDLNATYEQVGQDTRVDLTCGYTLTRTWVARDECGNTSEPVSQTITVIDTQAPVAPEAPMPASYQCPDDVPAAGELTATDACQGSITAIGVDSAPVPDMEGCGFTITRTWTFADSCQNTSSVSQLIHVQDTTAPEITAPADETYQCLDDVSEQTTRTATDNCDADVEVTFGQTQAGASPTIITRTWTARDDCGNEKTVTQTITVEDTIDPETPELPDVSGVCEVEVVPPTTTDNCVGTVTGTTLDPMTYSTPGTYVVHWTFVDGSGNTITVPQNVIVQDGGGTISGHTFEDLDRTCTRTDTSPLLEGLTITLADAQGNVIATDITDAAGFYEFKGCQLKAGTYFVTAPGTAGALFLASEGTRTVILTDSGESTDNDFCYRRDTPECYGILLVGPDIPFRLRNYMVTDPAGPQMPAEYITIAGAKMVYDPSHPNPLSEALDAKRARDGKPFCTIYLDSEFVGANGMWSGLSEIDQARLKQEIMAGVGFVYGEPTPNAALAPVGQVPNVLPVSCQFYCDHEQTYKIVDPTSPLAIGLPPVFNAASSCQNTQVTPMPIAGITYENVHTVAVSASGNPHAAYIPGTGGPSVITLDYGATGGRVAIIGTDPYPQSLPTPGYETDFASIFRLYYNALLYTGHISGDFSGPSPLKIADALRIAGGLVAAPPEATPTDNAAFDAPSAISIVDAVRTLRKIRHLDP